MIIVASLFLATSVQATEKKRHPMIPRSIVGQHAGSIGYLSIGCEWEYGKNDQWATALLVGVIEKYQSNRAKATLTLKQTYSPWHISLNSKISLRPLNCGLFLNTIYSHHFWAKEPEKYPSGYYRFSPRIRPNIFIGQEITLHIPQKEKMNLKSVSFYYEFNTSDIYLCSYFPNTGEIRLKDILSLGLGVKLNF